MARRSISRSTSKSINDQTDVVVGVVRAPHGIRGEVRVEPLSDRSAERFRVGAKLRCEGVGELTVTAVRGTAQDPILRFDGYDDRSAAETLRNKDLTIERSEARRAAGAGYLWGDLVGLEVVTPVGRALGVVTEIVRAGEADVLVVRGDAGETMLPALESVIKDVDLAAGRIVAVPQEELS